MGQYNRTSRLALSCTSVGDVLNEKLKYSPGWMDASYRIQVYFREIRRGSYTMELSLIAVKKQEVTNI